MLTYYTCNTGGPYVVANNHFDTIQYKIRFQIIDGFSFHHSYITYIISRLDQPTIQE